MQAKTRIVLHNKNEKQQQDNKATIYDINDYATLVREDEADDIHYKSKTGKEAETVPELSVTEKIKESISKNVDTLKIKEDEIKQNIIDNSKKVKENIETSVQQAIQLTETKLQQHANEMKQKNEKHGKHKVIDKNTHDLPVAHHKVIDSTHDQVASHTGIDNTHNKQTILEHLKKSDDVAFKLKKEHGKVSISTNTDNNPHMPIDKHLQIIEDLKFMRKRTKEIFESYEFYGVWNKVKDFFSTRTHTLNNCLYDIYNWAHLYSMKNHIEYVDAKLIPAALRMRLERAISKCKQQFNDQCFYKNTDQAIEHVLKAVKEKKKCPQVDSKGLESDGITIIKE